MKKIIVYASVWLLLFSPIVLAATPDQEDVKIAAQSVDAALPDLAGTPWEGWSVPTGAELTVKENEKGETIKTLSFPSGVVFTQTKRGTFSVDNSGKGAVFCVWMIYTELKASLENCPEPPRVPLNWQEAYFWLSLASISETKGNLATYKRQQVIRNLSPEQIEELDKRVAAWTPKIKASANDNNSKTAVDFSNRVEHQSLQESAQGDDPTAQFELASMYEHGTDGTDKNFFEAEKWYRKAAEQGNADAQFRLGKLYAEGERQGQVSDEDLIKMLDEAIDRINDFIIANSPTPITKQHLEKKARQKQSRYGSCVGADVVNGFKPHMATPEQFKAGLDDFLSVPRPAVTNPCL